MASNVPHDMKGDIFLIAQHFESGLHQASAEMDLGAVCCLCRELGRNLEGRELSAAFNQMDTNASGTVDISEFTSWWLDSCKDAKKSEAICEPRDGRDDLLHSLLRADARRRATASRVNDRNVDAPKISSPYLEEKAKRGMRGKLKSKDVRVHRK